MEAAHEKSQRSESNRQPPVYKTGARNSEAEENKALTGNGCGNDDASLTNLMQEYPELGDFVGRWPD